MSPDHNLVDALTRDPFQDAPVAQGDESVDGITLSGHGVQFRQGSNHGP